jgi:hypothetical protein
MADVIPGLICFEMTIMAGDVLLARLEHCVLEAELWQRVAPAGRVLGTTPAHLVGVGELCEKQTEKLALAVGNAD